MNKIIIMALASALGASAFAGRGQNREHRQEKRISEGAESGQLTRHETKRLQRGQKKIDRFQEKAMADGQMSAEEKLKLEKMQDHQSRAIKRQKHDGQTGHHENSSSEAPVAEPSASPAESE
jgi:hypothetical protein